jgi:hypothetical protein
MVLVAVALAKSFLNQEDASDITPWSQRNNFLNKEGYIT